MKIHIANPDKMRFDFMEQLFTRSIYDIGHDISSIEDAEMIIWIQHGEKEKYKGKVNVLLQVEDWLKRPDCNIREYVPSGYDAAWGFDIDNPHESYLPLGYHPSFECEIYPSLINPIGFIGCLTDRRKEIHEKSRNKFMRIREWNYSGGLMKCAECQINIHIHSYKETRFTPWDRIARMLHGGLFFVIENCYCPMKTVKQFKIEDYDSAMDYWLSCPQSEIFEIAHEMRQEYILNFDMRSLLEQKIKEV